MKPIIKSYTLTNGRTLTLATVQEKMSLLKDVGYMVTVGHSVKLPEDTQDDKLAMLIAGNRTKKGYVFAMYCKKRLSRDFLAELMDSIASEFNLNFEGFVPLGSKSKAASERVKKEENGTTQRPSNNESVGTGSAGEASKTGATKKAFV